MCRSVSHSHRLLVLTLDVDLCLAVDDRAVGHTAPRAFAVLHRAAHIAFSDILVVVLGSDLEDALSLLRRGLSGHADEEDARWETKDGKSWFCQAGQTIIAAVLEVRDSQRVALGSGKFY